MLCFRFNEAQRTPVKKVTIKLNTMNVSKEIIMTIVKYSSNRIEGEEEILEINEQQLRHISKELTELFFLHNVSK